MAINKITAPGSTPATFWPQVINQLSALVIDKEDNERFVGGFVKQGAFFNIGGVMYIADADTAISGTRDTAIAIKITPSGDTASASYASSLSGVAWNGAYKGNYDGSGNLYIYNAVAGDYVRDGLSSDVLVSNATGSNILAKTVTANLIGIVRICVLATGSGFITIVRNGVNIYTSVEATGALQYFNTPCLPDDSFSVYFQNFIGTCTIKHVSIRTSGNGFTVV